MYYAVLDDPIKGLNGVNLHMLVTHIQVTYAQISQPDMDNNLADFNNGINPGLPLAVYTRKQEKCQVFASDAGVPISKATMVTTGTKHALAAGNMTLAWREWKRWPIAEHTWPNWKMHWTAAFAEMHDINWMTAEESPFGANAAKEEVHARQIATSLDNLANASIQKNSTINSLVALNTQLTQALDNMQAAMARMYPPTQTPPHQGTARRGGQICLPLQHHWGPLLLQQRASHPVSTLPTGGLSSQTGTKRDTVGPMASR